MGSAPDEAGGAGRARGGARPGTSCGAEAGGTWDAAEGQWEGGAGAEQARGVKEGDPQENRIRESPAVLGVPLRRELGAYTFEHMSARTPVTLRKAEGRGIDVSLCIPDPILGGEREKGRVASLVFKVVE